MYSDLIEKAYSMMVETFQERDHRPSPGQLRGLKEIPETLSMMLNDEAKPLYYVSSLDPGVGKSTAIGAWIRAYLENPLAYGGYGVLVGLDRLEEIESFVKHQGIPEGSFAVMVSGAKEAGEKLNGYGLGCERASEAIVLFTTKAQIKLRCGCRDFESVTAFHFKGKPRRVKIWDESFSVGREVTLNPYDLGKLLAGFADFDTALSGQIQDLMNDMTDCKDGDIYQVPELPLTRSELVHTFKWKNDNEKDLADLLGQIAGQPVTIRTYKKNQVVVDCVRAIPDDFAPCLITDASGRIKETYHLQQTYMKNVKFINKPDQNKSYRNFIIYVWRRSSGKIALINDRDIIAMEMAKVILSRPGEDFLILHYASQKVLIDALLKHLPEEEHARVKSLTWGRHTAVNTFASVPNMIITSPYFFRDYTYEAMARAAAMSPTGCGNMSTEEISRFRKGEIAHHLLQGALRGSGRKSEGDTCPESRLWLISAPQTGIEKELPTIFPECKVLPWVTEGTTLTPHQQKAIDYLNDVFAYGVEEVPEIKVRHHLEIKSSYNFKRDIREKQPFQDALIKENFTAVKRGKSWSYVKMP